jgi:ferredoxin-NADP reductase
LIEISLASGKRAGIIITVTRGRSKDIRSINMKNWLVGTLLKKSMAAENVMSLTFSLPELQDFQPGQHFDIRLTAPGGYMAERSYSIANPPEEKGIVEYGVQLLENGEVSPYLWNLAEGKQVEMRGPIGGHFIWNVSMPGPSFSSAVVQVWSPSCAY